MKFCEYGPRVFVLTTGQAREALTTPSNLLFSFITFFANLLGLKRWRHNIGSNDIQHNDTQYRGVTLHDINVGLSVAFILSIIMLCQNGTIMSIALMLGVIMLGVIMLSVITLHHHAECR